MSPEEILSKSSQQIRRLVAVREFINPISYYAAHNLWNGTRETMRTLLIAEYKDPEELEQTKNAFAKVLEIREDLLQDFERAARRNPKWWFRKLKAQLRR